MEEKAQEKLLKDDWKQEQGSEITNLTGQGRIFKEKYK